MEFIITAIVVILGLFALIGSAWTEFVTNPIARNHAEAEKAEKEKAAADYYAKLKAMTVEEHRAELVKVEEELKASVIEHVEHVYQHSLGHRRTDNDIACDVLRCVENSYGWPWRVAFEQQVQNRYRLHLTHIIRIESQCDDSTAHSASNRVLEKKVFGWVKPVLDQLRAKAEKRWAEAAIATERARFIASKYAN